MKKVIVWLFGVFLLFIVPHAYSNGGDEEYDEDYEEYGSYPDNDYPLRGVQCAVPFTTENKSVKCEIDSKTMLIKCIVTGFDDIPPVNFQEIPSIHELYLVFSYPCSLRADCAEKFKCTGCDPSGDLDCPTTSSDISGGE